MSSQGLPGTMKLFIIMSCLHAGILAQGNISCKIPPVEPMAATSLTCTFPEDISLSKKDFFVVHTTSKRKPVLDCLWAGGTLECFDKPGYVFNRTVTNQLTIVIPQAFSNMTGDYYCKVSDSTNFNIQHCQLDFRPESKDNGTDINTENDTEEVNRSLAIGLGIGLVCLTIIAITVLIFILKRRKDKGARPAREMQLFIGPSKDVNKMDATETRFERYLKKAVLQMYPQNYKSLYFVPPVYFNRHGYEKQSHDNDEDIYVPKATDENVVKHDQAMQHFLHCLREMAEQGKEEMFVLTQFKYEDYLTSVNTEYPQHGLPMPADLTDEDVNVGCFDFLMVHRHHGVLAGVVKAVSDHDVKNVNDKKKATVHAVVLQVNEAVKQLKKAENMIKHLMSADKKPFPKIRQTLILPNLSSTSLRHAIASTELVQSLRERMGMDDYGEPINQCLCSDQLSDPKMPWKVKPNVVKNMKKWWDLVMTTQVGETRMNDDVYDNMIARFFGPATQSKLKLKDDHEEMLPKILAEAVSLTGDLYSTTMLDEDQKELLYHSIVFLVGPPNTGKTRMLTLAGNKWLSYGHDVFIVKDETSKGDPFLSQHLKKSMERKNKVDHSKRLHVYDEKCDLTSNTSIEDCVHRIIEKQSRNGKQMICILLDVAHIKGKHVSDFNNTLHKWSKDHLLWVSCSRDMRPSKGYVMECQQILNCPPAVIREAQNVNNDKKEDARHPHGYLHPTDGPPVKHIEYNLSVGSPQDSRELGNVVGEFLATDLRVTATKKPAWSKVQALPLNHKDIFIVFESNSTIIEDSEFLAGLRDNNIKVKAVKIEGETVVVDEGVNTAWAMNVRHTQLYRMKRKIVVYVQSYFEDKETKQRAITSCTSQLILVQPNTSASATCS